jgi:hypothetical protein
MGALRFYGACVRRAPAATWWLIGTISTLATFGPPLAAKLFHFADPSTVDTLLVLALPFAAVLCLMTSRWGPGPFSHSWRRPCARYWPKSPRKPLLNPAPRAVHSVDCAPIPTPLGATREGSGGQRATGDPGRR